MSQRASRRQQALSPEPTAPTASTADASIVGEAPDPTDEPTGDGTGATSGLDQEMEDLIPADLLADMIQVNDHDIKPEVRQDYARRMSKYYQFLVGRLKSVGCHPHGCRPTALPEKCLPSAK